MIRDQAETQTPADPDDQPQEHAPVVGDGSVDLDDVGGTGRLKVSLGVIPTLFTLGNLICGFTAIRYATMDPEIRVALGWTPLEFAGAMIFLGMLLDAVDGTVARLTRSSSELGAYIDSLADMVTFGVAPAFLTLQLVNIYNASDGIVIEPAADKDIGKLIWAVCALYVSCAALRLARYSLESSQGSPDKETNGFTGLPTPGAAGAVASLIVLHQHLTFTRFADDVPLSFVRSATFGIPVVTLLCALAMVSSIPYLHFTNRFLGGQRSFAYTVAIIVTLVLCVWWLPEIMALAFTAYVLWGPVCWFNNRRAAKVSVLAGGKQP